MGTLLDNPASILGLVVAIALIAGLVYLIVKLTRRTESPVAALQSPPPVSPGWYEQKDGSQRWWDGNQWSEQMGEAEE